MTLLTIQYLHYLTKVLTYDTTDNIILTLLNKSTNV